MPETGYNCPPTPPPDRDPAAWEASVDRLQALGARRLCLTHFGPFDDVAAHLDALLPELDVFLEIGRRVLGEGGDAEALTAAVRERMVDRLGDVSEQTLRRLELASPSYVAALGLARYVTRGSRGAAPGGSAGG
jgi:glyoxylase-like metal-dependent hydrolase (beta-lactamase superfamily II)